MRYNYVKITISRIDNRHPDKIDERLQWIGSSLGLFNLRDKDKSCYRLFIALLKNAKKEIPLSSDEIAYMVGLSRGTVVHHLNKLLYSRIIKVENGKYMLRAKTLSGLIDLIKQDTNKMLDELKDLALEVDKKI